MNDILKALKKVREAEAYHKEVDSFAKAEYDNKFRDLTFANGAYQYYGGFALLSDTEITVKFCYGVYDSQYNDSFTVTVS
jgi:hypothetical protein